jgi:hypothetical protein
MITEAFQAILKHVAPGQEDIGQNQSKACYKLYTSSKSEYFGSLGNTSIDCDDCWMSESEKNTILNNLLQSIWQWCPDIFQRGIQISLLWESLS